MPRWALIAPLPLALRRRLPTPLLPLPPLLPRPWQPPARGRTSAASAAVSRAGWFARTRAGALHRCSAGGGALLVFLLVVVFVLLPLLVVTCTSGGVDRCRGCCRRIVLLLLLLLRMLPVVNRIRDGFKANVVSRERWRT